MAHSNGSDARASGHTAARSMQPRGARKLAFFLLRLTGLPFLLREAVQRRRASIVCYHNPQPEVFETHIKWLRKHYRIISLRELMDWRLGKTRHLPAKSLVVTLDDGHRGNAALVPVLMRHGIPATLFVCSAIAGTRRHFWWTKVRDKAERESLKSIPDAARVERLRRFGFEERREFADSQAISMAQARTLARFVDLQSHSRFHPILPLCDRNRAWDEIAVSKYDVQRLSGKSVYAFAYPNGSYSEEVVELVRAAGYECAVTIDGGFNTRSVDPFRLARIRLSDDASIHELSVKVSGAWSIIERSRWRKEPRTDANPLPVTSTRSDA